MNMEIAGLVRKIRFRVDQELVQRNIDPIFKENYYGYDKHEFLIDANFEFVKLKNLLSKSPKMLREDPVLSIDYLKVINLIKQKKLLEDTQDLYDPNATVRTDWHDVQAIGQLNLQREEQERNRVEKSLALQETEVSV